MAPAGEPPAPAPAPASPLAPPAEPDVELDAGLASPGDATSAEPAGDATVEAAVASCTPSESPPRYDVFFELGTRKAKWGPELWARVRVPGTSLQKEIWTSPAPTRCESQVEGERLTFHCITADGESRGWVGVVGEELVLESRRGEPELAVPAPPPGVAPPAPPPPRPFERDASVKVPCGTRLRLHPSTRSLM